MSRSSSPVVRRATRTYGRRRDTSDHDISFDAANTSVDSREDSHSSTSLTLEHDLPPSSDDFDASNTSPLSAQAADADADASDDDEEASGGASRFQFSWRAKLKQIDDDDFELPADSRTQVSDTKPSEAKATVPTRPASPADQDAEDVFGGTLSSLTNSAQSSSLVIRTRAPRRIESLPASDPESDAEGRPSTPQTSPRHPINTPETRSSPTPPTSIEMQPKKGKKTLHLENEDELASTSKSTATKPQRKTKASDGAKRVKAPTKKERLETQKATARIVADQPVSINRVQQHRYFLTDLIGRLHPPAVAKPATKSASRSRSQTPPIPSTSDPIQAFSSSPASTGREHQRQGYSSKNTTQNTEFKPTGLLGAEPASSDSAESSDDELPDVSAILAQDKKKRDEQERRRRLYEIKQRALEKQRALAHNGTDDDDGDVLVIEDDMKSVAREEGQTRRAMAAHGVHPSKARQRQLALAGPVVRREDALLELKDEEVVHLLETAATASFIAPKQAKPTHKPVHLGPEALNKLVLARAEKQKLEAIRQKEQEWIRDGGRIKERPEDRVAVKSAEEALQAIAEKHRAAPSRSEDVEMAEESGSDEDYKPDDGASHDGSQDSDGGENENEPPHPLHRGSDDEEDEAEDESSMPAPLPRRALAPGRHRPLQAVLSDDEEDAENQPPPVGRVLVRDSSFARPSHSPQPMDDIVEDENRRSLAHRSSMSSLGDRTEDGTDKENDVRLSFDRGEDKENTAVAIQSPGLSLNLGRSFGSLLGPELTASPVTAGRSVAPDGVRSPLKELAADEDDDEDPFVDSPSSRSRRVSTRASSMALADASLDLDLGSESGLQPAFSLSRKGKERAHSASPIPLAEAVPIGEGGGFSQFFTQEGGGGFEKLKAAQRDDDISLTPDCGLEPALEVDSSLVKKADEIFVKEQEFVVRDQQERRPEHKPELFVDENGFLTQTRPEFRSPLRSLMTPSQPTPMLRLSSPATLLSSVRKPLAPLLTQDPDDDDYDPLPPRRLRKRDYSLSPEPLQASGSKVKNAFDLLGRRDGSLKAKGKKPLRSEFIEGEAEESDEEAMFGFGHRKKDEADDEEEDDDEQDQTLAELVDDKEMDEKTLAEEAVIEKHREHLDEDDKLVEKIHRDAVAGKLRVKRRDRGVGFEDSDSEDDDDARRIRSKNKRRRTENDNIAALAKKPETQAFAKEYEANMVDADDEFAHLNRDEMEMDVEEPESGQEREAVTAARLREELLEAAQQETLPKRFDPLDVSWMEGAEESPEEMDSDVRVREVDESEAARTARRPNSDEPKTDQMDDADRVRMTRWAKSEAASRTAGILGRNNGGSAAVTGHGKSKAAVSGSGSFKNSRASAASSSSAGKPGAKIAKAPSVLIAVSSRRDKFAN
ncbi:hypothetical protein BV20DRAFT_932382 [Pilatotrama ljubarskyi]|nr:hypothetical protein BV20DRAFT_932382 [Pilatotrama ljubarskyi]